MATLLQQNLQSAEQSSANIAPINNLPSQGAAADAANVINTGGQTS